MFQHICFEHIAEKKIFSLLREAKLSSLQSCWNHFWQWLLIDLNVWARNQYRMDAATLEKQQSLTEREQDEDIPAP